MRLREGGILERLFNELLNENEQTVCSSQTVEAISIGFIFISIQYKYFIF
jgi:hypothetical protein